LQVYAASLAKDGYAPLPFGSAWLASPASVATSCAGMGGASSIAHFMA
jgi:hypothetical protein